MKYDRTVSDETLTRMVQHIEPTWTVSDATPATGGHHIVYLLTVETETGTRDCVLKATPPGKDPMCDVEARMLAIVAANTTMPVPEVFGVVDEHGDLPAPFFLASTLPGEDYQRTELARVADVDLETLARSCGRHLASLHDLDLVSGYGYVGVEYDRPLAGDRPSSNPDQLVVRNPTDDWKSCLRDSVEAIVEGLAETRFDNLVGGVEPALDGRLDRLSGRFDPVVCRIDNSIDNLLVDPETSEVTGFLDWEFQFAGTPAYDLAFVTHSMAGGAWAYVPGVPNHEATIRRGFLDGYREVGPGHVVEQYETHGECYELLALCHAMLNFETVMEQADATDEQRDGAAEALTDAVSVLCENQ
ncbi:phosphotransferase family protein [Haloarchaeobius sp. HME9146]|uniref:phosphotransferase family protein n=1 Tax=Haloarchaeobius sp. HME9146 TaxID=2978732 RepID=UPI0021C2206F|nr:phosphotransferase [Haloarchaeobius sp. HME9146]MCT9095934.1 phosphotransferase [Haloarchaeobius sp. HME9146]